jgi:bifunctional enzyme CysN/CysC
MKLDMARDARSEDVQIGPGVLRLVTCGSVDDGKSTLIGRLLFDLQAVPEDQLRSLHRESLRFGKADGALDLALLLDGLEAEQEQGITIDVAYRYFQSSRRSFIVADAPGHEQYTRNMATGASVSDAAILLVDARKGGLQQTRRHSLIASLFGVRYVILAVNKMDLVDFSESVFRSIQGNYEQCAASLGVKSVRTIPISARHGDNVVSGSRRMSWYSGPPLLSVLEDIDVKGPAISAAPARILVQRICRSNSDFRAISGIVTQGRIAPGTRVTVAGSNRTSVISRLVSMAGDLREVTAWGPVMAVLADELDVSRGDVLCAGEADLAVTDQFAGHLLWFHDKEMIPERSYLMKIGARTIPATVTALKHRIDVNSGAHIAARTLELNELAFCNFSLSAPVPLDSFENSRDHGSFILIDRVTNDTVGAGVVAFELRRAPNLHAQELRVDKAARAAIKGHRPAVLWMTGFSGAGKSTIANLVDLQLNALGCHTYVLDGDNVRRGLNRDLGFTEVDRVENIRRVAEVARYFTEAGLIVLVSLISPYRLERQMARERFSDGEFIEVFVDAPLEVCRQRDPKGLYHKAAEGELKNFTGVDAPYEPPERPDIHLKSGSERAPDLAVEVIDYLRAHGVIGGRTGAS